MSDDRRQSDPRADNLRRRFHDAFGATDEIPVPVEDIAVDLLGLWVEEVDDLPVSGALIPSERVVLLNRDEPPVRRRFTLAHEIGHWVCQCDEGRDPHQAIMCRGVDIAEQAGRALEREANAFAATLLMPADSVCAVPDAERADSAATFGVSPVAMDWRFFNLGLTQIRPTSKER